MRNGIAGSLLALTTLLGPAAGAEATATAKAPAVPFVEDDYDRALREARANGRPLFVEAWAPW